MNQKQYYLSKINEETAEIIQMLNKSMQFGLSEVFNSDLNPQHLTNLQRLHGEIHDLLAVIEIVFPQIQPNISVPSKINIDTPASRDLLNFEMQLINFMRHITLWSINHVEIMDNVQRHIMSNIHQEKAEKMAIDLINAINELNKKGFNYMLDITKITQKQAKMAQWLEYAISIGQIQN